MIGVCFVLMRWLVVWPLAVSEKVLVTSKTKPWLKSWNSVIPLWEGERGWDWINNQLVMTMWWSLHKNLWTVGFIEFPSGWTQPCARREAHPNFLRTGAPVLRTFQHSGLHSAGVSSLWPSGSMQPDAMSAAQHKVMIHLNHYEISCYFMLQCI